MVIRMLDDVQKTNFGFKVVSRFVANLNGKCQMQPTNCGLHLFGGNFTGTINGMDFVCTGIEMIHNGVLLYGIDKKCPLSQIKDLHCNLTGFAYKQISSFRLVDFEKEDF